MIVMGNSWKNYDCWIFPFFQEEEPLKVAEIKVDLGTPPGELTGSFFRWEQTYLAGGVGPIPHSASNCSFVLIWRDI